MMGTWCTPELQKAVELGYQVKKSSPGELYDIIEDAGNKIHDIRICTEDMVEVDVSKVEEEVIPSSKTKIFIALHCKFYSVMGKIRVVLLYGKITRASLVF